MSCARVAEAVDDRALCAVFDELFGEAEQTTLLGAGSEPLYTPVRAGHPAIIQYRADYVASALHEVAHWCIAGKQRRQREDYGYWYEPDGRDAAAQAAFVRVEARPQALEWSFAQACGHPFRLSLDNLDAPPDGGLREDLAEAVTAAAIAMRDRGLPPRAERFFQALCRRFRPDFSRIRLEFSTTSLL